MTAAIDNPTRGRELLDHRRQPAGWAPARAELRWMLREARAPKWRTMREFAESEIVIPDGRFRGSKFRVRRQPFTGLWLDAVDSGKWSRVNTLGPTQTGKTLLASIVPLAYHLFELGETVIFGLPDANMAADKWERDLLPAIAATRYAALLPTSGEGSRGGKVKSAVTFKNGATLKFLTGGGGDKQRAGFTARVLIVTEKDGFAATAGGSAETNKLEQLRARTRHYGSLARIYEECTVTTDQAPTWHDHLHGTQSRIFAPCVHCGEFISPEREHLVGWQEAESEVEARLAAAFICPKCGAEIGDEERHGMNERAVLAHKGQTIDRRGRVHGNPPPVETLSFRWSAFQNQFLTAGDIAVDEWRAARATNEDDAERKLHQFVWAIPYVAHVEQLASLTHFGLRSRLAKQPRGLVPADCVALTVGCDLGLRRAHWVAIAWLPGGSSTVIDYGTLEIDSDQLGHDRATLAALAELRDLCERGWTWEGSGRTRPADAVGIDAGYQGPAKSVYQFIRARREDPATADRYWATMGFGHGQLAGHSYSKPKKTGAQVLHVGEDYHVSKLAAHRVPLVEFSADSWKTWQHNRLSCDIDHPGAMRLFATLPKEHATICRHFTAEKSQIEYDAAAGERIVWVQVYRQNHYLDAAVIADVLGHFCGVRVLEPEPVRPVAATGADQPRSLETPHGQAFSILDR